MGVVERHDGIRDAVKDAVVEAADGARVIDDAERLPTLQHGQANYRPSVGEAAGKRGLAIEIAQLVDVIEVDHMGAVKVGRSVAVAQVERIIAVVEQA